MDILKLAIQFEAFASEVSLKDYRDDLDSEALENILSGALKNYRYEDVDVTYNDQHYGWFVWDWKSRKHVQKDMNDFESDDTIDDVRDFVASLTKIRLEDYE
jgi:hypothetical protein